MMGHPAAEPLRPGTPVILLTGADGQVGWELQRALMPLGQVIAHNRNELDLTDTHALRRKVSEVKPRIIVNAAAYTAVDRAETEPDVAMQVNGEAPSVLAEEGKRCNALLVHFSTDYVFGGEGDRPYSETDSTNPINEYGRSKLAGEQAVRDSGVDYLIFRTSWVYAARGRNFLRSILRLANERDQLSIVDDQVGAPTWARLIAETTTHCLTQSLAARNQDRFRSDIYNLVSRGAVSWFGFATTILDITGQSGCKLSPITTEEYPTAAQRPQNSRLSPEKLERQFGLYMPDWRRALELCIAEL